MSDNKKVTSDSVSSHDSDIFSLSEDSFFNNLSEIEDLRSSVPSHDEVANKKLQAILSITEQLMTTYDASKIFEMIMSKAIDLTQAERGYLILVKEFAEKERELEVAYVKNMELAHTEDALKQVSSTIINHVIDEKRVEIVKNALKDEEYEVQMSIVNLQLKSIMCAPMIVKDKVIGIIYVENRTIPGIFNKEAGELLTLFGNLCGVAIENIRLIEANMRYASSLEKMVEERTVELQNQKRYNENIIKHIGEILITIDNKFKIITVNDAMHNILGLEADSFIGAGLDQLYDADSYNKIEKAVACKTNVSNIKCRLTDSLGNKISFSATVSPIIEDGKLIGSIVINTNLTEMEKYEAERLERKELESITMAAVTANDQINTPLGVIIGRATILGSMFPEDEKAQKNIDVIKNQSYRIKDTLDEMKKITKIKEKEYKLDGMKMLDLEASRKNK